ncbi:hypothetical protein MOK15_08660 [Sphingobium sp. BYY-5]|uniref:hypothetical protein n=1 Tax=Sphingobium sp. BYY-5 TaxID=2926400 RepID=UPI001FA71766|nr:hypothetical protein [Sphingobium sp. BYY-5]MCI4590165.1 hypothetical protein [Sphingobium sp. BYY-5]
MPVPPIVVDFEKFCEAQDQSTQAILVQADQAGWKTSAVGAPKDFDPATQRLKDSDQGLLRLAITSTRSAGEQRQTCGLTSTSGVPGIVAAMQTALGFKPALNMGTAATFYAVRTGNAWQSGAGLNPSEFATAKAKGQFYSIVASTMETGAAIYALHVMPAKAP